jgi:2-oxoglutarate ferredoxin oxidoreductase subunit alpha
VNKRLFKKLPLLRKEIDAPAFYGDVKADLILVGWGSTYGVMKEAVDELSNSEKVAMLHFSEIYPFPSPCLPPLEEEGWRSGKFDYLNFLNNAKFSVCIENNATGQFARLMRAETGYDFKHRINKIDGRPFTTDGLIGEINASIGRL